MFFVEKIMFNSHAILHSVMDSDGGHNHGHGHGHDETCTIDHSHAPNLPPSPYTPPAPPVEHTVIVREGRQGLSGSRTPASPLTSVDVNAESIKSSAPEGQVADVSGSQDEQDIDTATNRPTSAPTAMSIPAPVPVNFPAEKKPPLSQKSAIVLLLAMSLHSLFETMALGIATDHSSALLMAASVGLHQPAESMALLV